MAQGCQSRTLEDQNRKIVTVIDNFAAPHHIDGFRALKLVFLVQNITSRTEPMHQGIPAKLKHHYRSILLNNFIPAIAKTMVKPSTIALWFDHWNLK